MVEAVKLPCRGIVAQRDGGVHDGVPLLGERAAHVEGLGVHGLASEVRVNCTAPLRAHDGVVGAADLLGHHGPRARPRHHDVEGWQRQAAERARHGRLVALLRGRLELRAERPVPNFLVLQRGGKCSHVFRSNRRLELLEQCLVGSGEALQQRRCVHARILHRLRRGVRRRAHLLELRCEALRVAAAVGVHVDRRHGRLVRVHLRRAVWPPRHHGSLRIVVRGHNLALGPHGL
mmetsp:Transcript_43972/g.136850  ORF Transcript_43972/g.136850 Transcript_43972/m.136850 type:complete len:233 (+) Transcript_43972:226-924(+)